MSDDPPQKMPPHPELEPDPACPECGGSGWLEVKVTNDQGMVVEWGIYECQCKYARALRQERKEPMTNNWRAKIRADGWIWVRTRGVNWTGMDAVTPQEATELRDQLTAAIAESERLADPFEQWWGQFEKTGSGEYARINGQLINGELARGIWLAARKANP